MRNHTHMRKGRQIDKKVSEGEIYRMDLIIYKLPLQLPIATAREESKMRVIRDRWRESRVVES
jgi:hypothetical protein